MGSYPPHRSSPGPPIMSGGGKTTNGECASNRNSFLILLSAHTLGYGYDGTAPAGGRNGP